MQAYLETDLHKLVAEEWDQLARQSPTHTVFQTFDWHRCWWNTFSDQRTLFLICIKENNVLVGVAPLMIVFKKKWRILKFIGTGQSDYCDFLYPKGRPDVLKEMIVFMQKENSQWDAAALDHIPEGSESCGLIVSQIPEMKLYLKKYSVLSSYQLVFDQGRDNLRKMLSKKSVKRHYEYFRQRPGYAVEHLRDREGIKRNLNEFFDQHIKRRKDMREESLFRYEQNRSFYKELAEQLSSSGRVVFSVLRSEGRTIAFHFGFLYDSKFIWYKPSFDLSLSKHSPGEVMLKELFEFTLTQDCREFDFTIGDEFFKSRFSNQTSRVISYKVFKNKSQLYADLLVNLLRKAVML